VADEIRAGSGAMFDRIADRYDVLNRILSFGIDARWRRRSTRALGLPEAPARVLDVATGTADLAIRIARDHPQATVVAVDPSMRMLRIARDKLAREGLSRRVHLIRGNAEDLPLRDRILHGVAMAFGIRNFVDRRQGLCESARVTRSDGRVVVLELSRPSGALGVLAWLHVRRVVPWMGALLSGAREYRYLMESMAAFPTPAEFSELMRRATLNVEEVRALTMGVCHLYVGRPAR